MNKIELGSLVFHIECLTDKDIEKLNKMLDEYQLEKKKKRSGKL